MGEPQCFDEMCFTVTGVEEVPGFLIRDGRRLVRVSVRVTNRGRKAQSEGLIRAYLVDGAGKAVGGVAGSERSGVDGKSGGRGFGGQ